MVVIMIVIMIVIIMIDSLARFGDQARPREPLYHRLQDSQSALLVSRFVARHPFIQVDEIPFPTFRITGPRLHEEFDRIGSTKFKQAGHGFGQESSILVAFRIQFLACSQMARGPGF